jgi:hypothetical protein
MSKNPVCKWKGCGFSDSSLDVVKDHQEKVHRRGLTYPCPTCGQKFDRYRSLVEHEEGVHGLVAPVQKKHCNKILLYNKAKQKRKVADQNCVSSKTYGGCTAGKCPGDLKTTAYTKRPAMMTTAVTSKIQKTDQKTTRLRASSGEGGATEAPRRASSRPLVL